MITELYVALYIVYIEGESTPACKGSKLFRQLWIQAYPEHCAVIRALRCILVPACRSCLILVKVQRPCTRLSNPENRWKWIFFLGVSQCSRSHLASHIYSHMTVCIIWCIKYRL